MTCKGGAPIVPLRRGLAVLICFECGINEDASLLGRPHGARTISYDMTHMLFKTLLAVVPISALTLASFIMFAKEKCAWSDLPPIFSPEIMKLSPGLNRSHSLSQTELEILGSVSPFSRC